MKTMRFFLCVFPILVILIVCGCDKNDAPQELKQQGEVGVYCVLEPGRIYNQQVVLKRLPLPGESQIYTSVLGAKVQIASEGKVYDFEETSVPGVYSADFQPRLGQKYSLSVVTPEGEEITSSMSIPDQVKIQTSNAITSYYPWYGPLDNVMYPGFVVSANNVNEDYYILIKGNPIYYGGRSSDSLKYWATNHTGADPITKVDLKYIESGLAGYQSNAFSYPEGDESIALSFYRDYLLIRNPHQFNPNRLLGTNYLYEEDGGQRWDDGFIVTAGPFAAPFPESTKVPLRDMSQGAIAAFGQDYCQTYSLKLSFVQLTGLYVDYFKNMPGFPDVQYNQSYVFENKEYSNINGGVGIFTSKVMTYNPSSNFEYTDDIHNKEFREYYLSNNKYENNTMNVSNQKTSECLGKDSTKAWASKVANTITLEAKDGKLLVYRKGEFNCGARIKFVVWREGNTIILEEVNTRGYAYCGTCPMEISCEVEGMKQGEYVISVQDNYSKEFYDPILFKFVEGEKKTVDLGYDL